MNLTPLCDELKKPEYQGKTDQEAADMVNAKTVAVRQFVDAAAIKAYAIREGFFADIDEACSDSDPLKRKVCKNIMAWIDDVGNRLATVNVDDSVTQSFFAPLIAWGIMSVQQQEVIMAMADASVRWVDTVGLGTIGDGHVRSAREMM